MILRVACDGFGYLSTRGCTWGAIGIDPFLSARIESKLSQRKQRNLGGGFKYFLFLPRSLGKWSNLTSIFFKMGWFNHQPEIYEGFDLWCDSKCFLQGPSRFSWSFPFPVHSSDHDVWYLSSAAMTFPPQFFRLSIDHQLLGNRPRDIPNLKSWTLKTSSLSKTQIGLPL